MDVLLASNLSFVVICFLVHVDELIYRPCKLDYLNIRMISLFPTRTLLETEMMDHCPFSAALCPTSVPMEIPSTHQTLRTSWLHVRV